MTTRIKLPKVTTAEVFDLMQASNVSRLHTGKDALPYIFYRRLLQLIRAGASKFFTLREVDIIEAYSVATRKQRREFEDFRNLYLLTVRTLLLKVENEKLQKQIAELKSKL